MATNSREAGYAVFVGGVVPLANDCAIDHVVGMEWRATDVGSTVASHTSIHAAGEARQAGMSIQSTQL